MDKIALIADTHGNLPALKEVLADIRKRGITRIFCLGDLVGKGPHGAEVIDICREVCEKTIIGNWDEVISRDSVRPDTVWNRQRLGTSRINYLKNLPWTIEFQMSGKKVRLFHTNQAGLQHHILHDAPLEKLAGMFRNTAFTGYNLEPDVVGYADIHYPYIKTINGKILFNIGSVGNPLDKALACYQILEGNYGSNNPGPFLMNIVRLPYDIELAVKQAKDEQMPFIEPYEIELRTAKYSSDMRKNDAE